jgi:hypothetical protein
MIANRTHTCRAQMIVTHVRRVITDLISLKVSCNLFQSQHRTHCRDTDPNRAPGNDVPSYPLPRHGDPRAPGTAGVPTRPATL